MTRTSPALVASGRSLAEPSLAPDGTAVVFSTATPNGTQLVGIELGDSWPLVCGPEIVWTVDPAPVGVHPMGGGSYCWLPDSSGLVYVGRDGSLSIVDRGGGVGRPILIADAGASFSCPSVTPSGRWVAFVVDLGASQELRVARVARVDVSDAPGSDAQGSGIAVPAPPADFRMDPAWGRLSDTTSVLTWHQWSVPDMPWDGGEIAAVMFDETTGEFGDTAIVAGASSSAAAGVRGISVAQPRCSPSLTNASLLVGFLDDSSGWKNVRVRSVSVGVHSGAVDSQELPSPASEPFEHGDPSWGPGARSWCWSPDGSQIAFVRNEEGFARLCTAAVGDGSPGATEPSSTEPGSEEKIRALGKAVHVGVSWARTATGAERIAAVRTGGKTPAQLVLYNPATSERVTIARGPVGAWDGLAIAEPTVVEWPSADGSTIHGRLYRPVGAEGALPTIVSVHGGPTSQTTVVFNPRYVHWMEQGWSVFVPDHRGSTGWGRDYQQAMNGGWGAVDVTDILCGVHHGVAEGWFDPTCIVAMGGSAGGFAVLNLLRAAPGLFSGGVALYPVTDLVDLDATTHRFERHYNAVIVGPRSNAAGDPYLQRSPAFHAASITDPLLVLHGDRDDVVPLAQSQRLVEAMRAAGRTDVELVTYAGEGHGFKKTETVLDEVSRIDAFLAARRGC